MSRFKVEPVGGDTPRVNVETVTIDQIDDDDSQCDNDSRCSKGQFTSRGTGNYGATLTVDEYMDDTQPYDNDSRRSSKSLGQLTREAIPRSEHYREAAYPTRPTLEELHNPSDLKDKARRRGYSLRPADSNLITEEFGRKGKVIKFGWLEGVYMRCLLNIWGVMLFLRLSWVIGQGGLVEGIGVVVLANIVTLLTSLSMSAVSTNGQIEGGGIYYMISRSLGPEFGGAIGLMFTLANSIAVAMYVVGFCESLQDLVKSFGLTIIDNGTNDIRVIGIVTLVLILVLAFVGMDWVTRAQMCLLCVLVASQLDFIIGSIVGPKSPLEKAKGFVGYDATVFKENMKADYSYFAGVDHDFFSVFSVFFPAVTGIVAGANLSGDLKDPSKAIPLGTLLAIMTTFISYIAYALMMGGCVLRVASGQVEALQDIHNSSFDSLKECNGTCKFGLQNDNQVMELVALWGPLIYGGCFAATLSSAIASLVGAPRVLQALARDKLYPKIGYFAKGYGANNDPIRGYILVFIIAFGCVLIAHLNHIAPLLSNFFLAAYALINFSVFHVSISKSPGWRPSFKYYNAWVSLLGTLLCIAVMFLIDWSTALFTFIIVVTLYLYVSYRKPEVNWGSSTQAQSYIFALRSALELNKVAEHVKNYRPQVLVLSGMPGYRPALIDFANLITKGKSLLICGHVIRGSHPQWIHEALAQKANKWLDQNKVKAFYALSEEGSRGSFVEASVSLMRMSGIGKLKPNMLLMGFKNNWIHALHSDVETYFNIIHSALDSFLAVGILRVENGFDYSTIMEDNEPIFVLKTDAVTEQNKIIQFDIADVSMLPGDGMSTPPSSPSLEESRDRQKEEATTKQDSYGDEENPEDGEQEAHPSMSPQHLMAVTQFRRKQAKGFLDVWWLFDDGGLTLLIPHILRKRSQLSECKLRIFSLANRRSQLDRVHKNLAALLSKFRIHYSDLIIIPDITKKAEPETYQEFEQLLSKFQGPSKVRETELTLMEEKTNRHLRLRELLMQHSKESTFICVTLPMPRKHSVSSTLYMAWLEMITRGMPPILVLRGNQNSVLTYYS